MNSKINEIQNSINICYKIQKQYKWLLDTYVADFFTKQYWNQFQPSWQTFIDNLSLEEVADLLSFGKQTAVQPLSLTCLQTLIKNVCLSRAPQTLFLERTKEPPLFWKNVKLKKRHEIVETAKICYDCAVGSNCFYIVDVGSGLGHLSRILCYEYGFNVLSIEAQPQLSEQARNLERQFRRNFSTRIPSKIAFVNMTVGLETTADDFLELIRAHFGVHDVRFGIVGLHACGDLTATLLRLFTAHENVEFITVVSCCYMKLSTPRSCLLHGFPMSDYCKRLNVSLSYNAREVACHAIETYVEKLRTGKCWELKIHAYRAAIEVLIVGSWPHLRHSGLNNVKCREGLTFAQYCECSLRKLGVVLSDDAVDSPVTRENLERWGRVVKFYSLKLMLAPLVETLILLDRMLFVLERGFECVVVAGFDPKVSPRNQVLVGLKSVLTK